MQYRAYLFDVQGTLLDFYTPVRAAVAHHLRSIGRDPAAADDLTRAWRTDYFQRVSRLTQSVEQWSKVQDEYVAGLRDVFAANDIEVPPDDDVRRIAASWTQLVPWPDTAAGLARIRSDAVIGCLSNTDMRTMIRLFKRLGIDWDVVLTAEVFGAFKPDARVYGRAVRYLGFAPSDVAMVASHPYDLHAAAAVGLGTVFLHRPDEYGDPGLAHMADEGEFGQHVESVSDIR